MTARCVGCRGIETRGTGDVDNDSAGHLIGVQPQREGHLQPSSHASWDVTINEDDKKDTRRRCDHHMITHIGWRGDAREKVEGRSGSRY